MIFGIALKHAAVRQDSRRGDNAFELLAVSEGLGGFTSRKGFDEPEFYNYLVQLYQPPK